MIFTTLELEGLVLIEPSVFVDERGTFFESFNKDKYASIIGVNIDFMQDNVSISKKNVLRGLHFQSPPFEQGKLVSVLKGSVLDVAVDIRANSRTFGQHTCVFLSGENKKQFWIPPGFAHGFLSLEDETIFSYKCSNVYSTENEMSLRWNDPDLNINWNVSEPILSLKDQSADFFSNFDNPFNF